MNIFALHDDPVQAAQAHCDTHVVKMILETAQLLSTAWHLTHNASYVGIDDPRANGMLRFAPRPPLSPKEPERVWQADGALPATFKGEGVWLLVGQRIYKHTHPAHPCTLWLRLSTANYRWAWQLGMALLAEYTYRYGKVHATTDVLRALELVPELSDKPRTPFAQAMPEELRGNDPVAAYRRYYVANKADLLKYTRRAAPDWLTK